MSAKAHFTRFLGSDPDRLHVAAHSHHPWPDVSFDAHVRAWQDAARLHDDKWAVVFGEVLPAAQRAVADQLGLPDPATVAFGPNTHDFLVRILSSLPHPTRVLTTDAEFHSAARQLTRLEEEGLAVVTRVAVEPFASATERFGEAIAAGGYDLLLFSQVTFDSGFVFTDLEGLVAAADPDAVVVIDGYHAFMALPTDLGRIAHRAFYTAGGYKYAMAGEGAAFLHCPPDWLPRPVDTGWFAGFADLEGPTGGPVRYQPGGARFLGATFDPTGLYRFVAVQRWLAEAGWTVPRIHAHVAGLQQRFLEGVDAVGHPEVCRARLIPPEGLPRGHFLTFRTPAAAEVRAALRARGVVCDHRGDRLRLGFGIYHDVGDVEELLRRLAHTR